MRAARHFPVTPSIPADLAGLRALADNLHWTWDRDTQTLFERLDPAAWEGVGGDPIALLAAIDADRWAELADDAHVVAAVAAATQRLADATRSPRWFQQRGDTTPLDLVAYFSPEFGLSETLPQYSGGLGVLAGDHLKAASDLGLPVVGIGLLYAEGYFHQRLDGDGRQRERFERLEPSGLAIHDTGVRVVVDLAGDPVTVRAWRVDVGRIPLYLLDTAVEGNSHAGAAVTDRLYGGDVEHRLRQEIVLGVGGVRVLRALGVQPQVFHTNEGHAGLLSLERIREFVSAGLAFDDAVEAVRAGGVFTTHTPVPAGIDRFDRDLMERYFGTWADACGIDVDTLMRLGHRDDEPDDPRFNMAVIGLRLAARSNGVAALHGDTSRAMFAGLWPGALDHEVPIGSITNGVHAHTWVSGRVDELLRRSVGGMWDGAAADDWRRVHDLAPDEVWRTRREGRAELVRFVRGRLGDDVLDPDALTIGFARRFATYKRATLLTSHPERLARLLGDPARPVQFVFAGKAHPADEPGKDMIAAIQRTARELGVADRFVFVPDYDMRVARAMYHGADVWLNTPRRPLEACGTSGMKAALNGALNCSILDGWWDECYDGRNGWAIDTVDDDDLHRRDHREATSLFRLLEDEIIPLFHTRDHDDVAVGWVERMMHNWSSLGPFVTASRMVRDYTVSLYEPAARHYARMASDEWGPARRLAAWKRHLRAEWPLVRFEGLDIPDEPAQVGDERTVRARIDLGGLVDDDVSVQLVHGRIDRTGSFVGAPHLEVMLRGDDGLFTGRLRVATAGAYGVSVRIVPAHDLLVTPLEVGLARWTD